MRTSQSLSRDVVFKGFRRSLRLVLPDGVDFPSACNNLQEKLSQSGEFFRGAKVLLDPGRRLLRPEEIETLRVLLTKNGVELSMADTLDTDDEEEERTETVRTTLRSGQRVESDGNVLVLGDVNPGAEVIAGRDVLVMGTVRGIIMAGMISGREAVVFAFQLRPSLLRLGDLAARSPNARTAWRAEIARVKDGHIVVEPFLGWQGSKSRRARRL